MHNFDNSADVVVVGGGGSGLSAAIEAASVGRRVILLEKAPELGGTTAWSIGSISATGTPHQIARGIKDTPAGHYEDMPKFAAHLKADDNDALRRILTDEVPETFRWLMRLGVEFFGPMPEPPHAQPRMHNVLPNSRAYIARLRRRARHLGVEIRLGVRARKLTMTHGRVDGVEAEMSDGRRITFRAKSGVVLASGDYSGSAELKRRYMSEDVARIGPVNKYSTGDGQIMGTEVGGRVLNAHLAHIGLRFVPPPRRRLAQVLPASSLLARSIRFAMDRLPSAIVRPFLMNFLLTVMEPSRNLYDAGAVLIGSQGELVTDTAENRIERVSKQSDHRAYVLMDAAMAKQFAAWPNFISTAPGLAYAYLDDYQRGRPDIFRTANTLEELATKAGMSAARLQATVAEINAQRSADRVRPTLSTGPFYLLGPAQLYVTFTDGGLAVDDRHRVLDGNDRPIPGLFAAGSAGQGGLLLEGHGHHLGWAFTSGRNAGRNAAHEVVTPATALAAE
jgi:succinate dehydrogenase/fumarate reductase flavoprotein subunit